MTGNRLPAANAAMRAPCALTSGSGAVMSAWTREAVDDTARQRILNGAEYDGNRAGRFHGGEHALGGGGEDEVHICTSQFSGKSGEPLEFSFGIPVLEGEVFSFDISVVAHPLPECAEAGHEERCRGQHTDARNALLLRQRSERPCNRRKRQRAEHGDGIAPVHSITWSTAQRPGPFLSRGSGTHAGRCASDLMWIQ